MRMSLDIIRRAMDDAYEWIGGAATRSPDEIITDPDFLTVIDDCGGSRRQTYEFVEAAKALRNWDPHALELEGFEPDEIKGLRAMYQSTIQKFFQSLEHVTSINKYVAPPPDPERVAAKRRELAAATVARDREKMAAEEERKRADAAKFAARFAMMKKR